MAPTGINHQVISGPGHEIELAGHPGQRVLLKRGDALYAAFAAPSNDTVTVTPIAL